MKKYEIKNKTDLKMHNILFCTTSKEDYEMERLMLLEYMPDCEHQYVLIEGYHCSCFDFDECTWHAIELNQEELIKLLKNTREYETLRKELKNFLINYKWDFKKQLQEENNENN
jgi:hypothetical protein